MTSHSRPRSSWKALPLLAPGLLWILILVMLPTAGLVVLSLLTRGAYGEIVWKFTVENFLRAAGKTSFGWTSDNLTILGRSIVVATVTTVLSIVPAYPLCFWIAARPARTRYFWLALVVVPLCTNVVIRTYAWMVLLAPGMPATELAKAIGLIGEDSALYPSVFAVYLGMVGNALPFAVLPIYTNVERMDWSIVEASRDLYASPWRVFRHGILPQTTPGLVVAVILTFIPALGMFVVPDLLGGAKYWLVGNLIQQQFSSSRDWPFGAALSLILVFLMLAGIVVLFAKSRRMETT